MEYIVRAAVVYLLLMILFRLSGKRSLGQVTTFDLVLLLIISEATQNELIGEDNSLTNAFLVIMTLFGIDIGLSLLKDRMPRFERILEGVSLIVVDDGRVLRERMHKARIDESDVLEAAREHLGIESMDQIKYAVLERDGHITVVPRT
jgi:uncharacterized membrane protein YcaP (DUF421 family)